MTNQKNTAQYLAVADLIGPETPIEKLVEYEKAMKEERDSKGDANDGLGSTIFDYKLKRLVQEKIK